jgi:hypothetical protein
MLLGLLPPEVEPELGSAFDCLCRPQAVRPAHCHYLVLQSGDYSVDRRFSSVADMPFHTASRTALQLYALAHGYSYLYVDVRERTVAGDRASAWMKLPLVSIASRYFDYVFVVDPDIVPGQNFTLPLRALSDRLQGAAGKIALMSGNAPSPAGSPCTGTMLFTRGVDRGGGSFEGAGGNLTRLLQHWWSAPDREPEFAAYKMKHVWEQQVIEAYLRRRTEFAGELVLVLPPALMGNPESPFMQHHWSDGSGSNAERHRKVQFGLLQALASAVATCDARPRCSELIALFVRWNHYRPVMPWALLHAGAMDGVWAGDQGGGGSSAEG